jgi:hypothetical protein
LKPLLLACKHKVVKFNTFDSSKHLPASLTFVDMFKFTSQIHRKLICLTSHYLIFHQCLRQKNNFTLKHGM